MQMMAKLPRLNYINIFVLFLSLVPYSDINSDPFVAVLFKSRVITSWRSPRRKDFILSLLQQFSGGIVFHLVWRLFQKWSYSCSSGLVWSWAIITSEPVFAWFAKTHHCRPIIVIVIFITIIIVTSTGELAYPVVGHSASITHSTGVLSYPVVS